MHPRETRREGVDAMSIMPTGAEPVSDRLLAENPAVVIMVGDRLGTQRRVGLGGGRGGDARP